MSNVNAILTKAASHSNSNSKSSVNSGGAAAELQAENARMLGELSEIRATLDGLEKERDFYFGKLRDIEVHCQENENEQLDVVKKILEILYATAVSVCFVANWDLG